MHIHVCCLLTEFACQTVLDEYCMAAIITSFLNTQFCLWCSPHQHHISYTKNHSWTVCAATTANVYIGWHDRCYCLGNTCVNDWITPWDQKLWNPDLYYKVHTQYVIMCPKCYILTTTHTYSYHFPTAETVSITNTILNGYTTPSPSIAGELDDTNIFIITFCISGGFLLMLIVLVTIVLLLLSRRLQQGINILIIINF